MKTIEVKTTTLELRKLTGLPSDAGSNADTLHLIEATLDNIPQGGFTPKDIRERNRIQSCIDKYRSHNDEKDELPILTLEDADYENLKVIVAGSRWASRDKVLQEFLDSFNIKTNVDS